MDLRVRKCRTRAKACRPSQWLTRENIFHYHNSNSQHDVRRINIFHTMVDTRGQTVLDPYKRPAMQRAPRNRTSLTKEASGSEKSRSSFHEWVSQELAAKSAFCGVLRLLHKLFASCGPSGTTPAL